MLPLSPGPQGGRIISILYKKSSIPIGHAGYLKSLVYLAGLCLGNLVSTFIPPLDSHVRSVKRERKTDSKGKDNTGISITRNRYVA